MTSPVWLPGFVRFPDSEIPQLRPLPTPSGLVIHSGATAPGVAEWLARNKYSCHLSWSSTHGELVQQVPLDLRAQHAGSANDWWGVEMPGPWDKDPRSVSELVEFARAVVALQVAANGNLSGWCRHSDLNPKKKDPGPGFDERFERALSCAGIQWRLP